MLNPQPSNSCHNVVELFGTFSEQELATIAQIKRFFEWTEGDPEFCREVDAGTFRPEARERLRRIGISFAPDELAILWKSPESVQQFMRAVRTKKTQELPANILEDIAAYPLFHLWARFLTLKEELYAMLRNRVLPVETNPAFDAWRKRRVHSARSELGIYGYHISHPVLSFELSDGCSVGCWFCAFAARKLTDNLDYAIHKEFFRSIVEACVDIFGAEQTGRTMLYCGTEPHDNPHYFEFLRDYTDICGAAPFTSTAVGTDAPWLRQLIAFYKERKFPASLRISVLSKAALFKIHELYSPEELLDVDLLMQMKEHVRPKVSSGRVLKEEDGLRGKEDGEYLNGVVPQGTIECMSGFMVSFVTRTIQLISPCYSSSKWPYGYRVFDNASFTDAADFRKAIESLIDRNMPESPRADMPMRFRDDLRYRPTDEGFDLVSPNQVHHFRGKAPHRFLGDAISRQAFTYKELTEEMVANQFNLITVVAMVKSLFDHGLLDEVYQ
ncbi:predicted Fe-S-cluster redox enzyme [Candidatus Moduliflexus flocculans]|uniref:Predicted Fe-S-cluster redox enzyme n=1 Tax=Candidatus Moduliflexus flocculans TaxID=1499966 RepID=A0A081BM55_9BACT|nr:predicted Fe-S-cluster redox enzyme [Candidatus Moduliflexus flocculans]